MFLLFRTHSQFSLQPQTFWQSIALYLRFEWVFLVEHNQISIHCEFFLLLQLCRCIEYICFIRAVFQAGCLKQLTGYKYGFYEITRNSSEHCSLASAGIVRVGGRLLHSQLSYSVIKFNTIRRNAAHNIESSKQRTARYLTCLSNHWKFNQQFSINLCQASNISWNQFEVHPQQHSTHWTLPSSFS